MTPESPGISYHSLGLSFLTHPSCRVETELSYCRTLFLHGEPPCGRQSWISYYLRKVFFRLVSQSICVLLMLLQQCPPLRFLGVPDDRFFHFFVPVGAEPYNNVFSGTKREQPNHLAYPQTLQT